MGRDLQRDQLAVLAPQLHGMGDVFLHGQKGKQAEGLVDHRRLFPAVLVALHGGGGLPFKENLPLLGKPSRSMRVVGTMQRDSLERIPSAWACLLFS